MVLLAQPRKSYSGISILLMIFFVFFLSLLLVVNVVFFSFSFFFALVCYLIYQKSLQIIAKILSPECQIGAELIKFVFVFVVLKPSNLVRCRKPMYTFIYIYTVDRTSGRFVVTAVAVAWNAKHWTITEYFHLNQKINMTKKFVRINVYVTATNEFKFECERVWHPQIKYWIVRCQYFCTHHFICCYWF